MEYEKTYTFTEAAKRILIPNSFKGKGSSKLINMLCDYSIIKPCSWYNYKGKNSYELTNYIKMSYPEIVDYFEEITTRDGWKQLKMTKYGVEHIWDFIIKLDIEDINKED